MEFDNYIFVFLRRNNEYISQGEVKDKEIGAGHFAFIDRMIKSRDMLAAGPLDGAGGLYFFNAERHTKESVVELLESDDSIKFKLFIPEVHKWHIPKGVVTFTYKNIFDLEKQQEN